jgi:hypothetical protein
MSMRHTILSSVSPLDLPYFSTLSHQRQDFCKSIIEHKMCALILYSVLSEICIILRRMYTGLYIKYTLALSEFSEILTFSFEKFSNVKFHENLSSGSRVVASGRTDGRT